MQCKTNIQQLRDENATDDLIQEQLVKLERYGNLFIVSAGHFLNDYNRTFKNQELIYEDGESVPHVKAIMAQFGVLLKDYKQMKRDKAFLDEQWS